MSFWEKTAWVIMGFLIIAGGFYAFRIARVFGVGLEDVFRWERD